VDCQVRRFVIETKQRSDPQITINGVNIERRNGNAVRVHDPGTLAGAAPTVARDIFEIVLGRNCSREFDRPIKSDPDARAADERKQSRTHLAMHIDHQIVFRAADLFEQIKKAERCAPSLSGLREIAPRKENYIRERGMMTDNLRVLRRDQPVNSRTRITRTQFHQHWDRMHNVPERGRLDKQNTRELGGLQVRLSCTRGMDLGLQLWCVTKRFQINVQRSTLNAQRQIQSVVRWTLDVGC